MAANHTMPIGLFGLFPVLILNFKLVWGLACELLFQIRNGWSVSILNGKQLHLALEVYKTFIIYH